MLSQRVASRGAAAVPELFPEITYFGQKAYVEGQVAAGAFFAPNGAASPRSANVESARSGKVKRGDLSQDVRVPKLFRLFAPKGHNSPAQGNALGTGSPPAMHAPKGHNRPGTGLFRSIVPLRADGDVPPDSVPRALPWADESQPFGLDGVASSCRNAVREMERNQDSDRRCIRAGFHPSKPGPLGTPRGNGAGALFAATPNGLAIPFAREAPRPQGFSQQSTKLATGPTRSGSECLASPARTNRALAICRSDGRRP
jgi:hypothetical protein